MKYPAASRQAHEQFCTAEGWTPRKTSTGKTGTHHVNYELALPDGRVLLTRISHPVDRSNYGADLWSHILRDQLEVSQGEFRDCVQNGVKPDRGGPVETPAESIPIGVVATLLDQFHLAEAEVMAMSKDEAIARMVKLFAARQSGS